MAGNKSVYTVERFLTPYEVLLAQRISEWINAFEAACIPLKNTKTLAEYRQQKLFREALNAAREDRAKYIQRNPDIPPAIWAIVFGVSRALASQIRNAEKGKMKRHYVSSHRKNRKNK